MIQRYLNFPTRSTSPVRSLTSVMPPTPTLPTPPDLSPNAKGDSPYPYQKEGIQWLAQRTRALLADEMGLGKTVQVLRALPKNLGAIIVCPASLRLVWRDEILSWRPDLSPHVNDPSEFRLPVAGEASITSFEGLPDPERGAKRWLIPDPKASACTLVVDEAHYVKNYRAQRSQKVTLLARQAARTWFLTGTPMLGKPKDLWGVLSAGGLEKSVFDSYATFLELFGAKRMRYGSKVAFWQFPDQTSEMPGLDEIRARMSRVALRRLRKDVLAHLPGKTYQVIPVSCSPELSAELDAIDSQWTSTDDLPPFELLSAVREKLAHDRIPAMLETVERFEEEKIPLVVWSAHRRPIEAFAGREGWGIITGDTDYEARRVMVDLFQTGLLSGIALTIQAGGVGINLSRAAHELFVDLAYTPAENAQAEDRLPRPGSKAEGISVLRMVADHPVDRRVLEILDRKQRLIDATTGGKIS